MTEISIAPISQKIGIIGTSSGAMAWNMNNPKALTMVTKILNNNRICKPCLAEPLFISLSEMNRLKNSVRFFDASIPLFYRKAGNGVADGL